MSLAGRLLSTTVNVFSRSHRDSVCFSLWSVEAGGARSSAEMTSFVRSASWSAPTSFTYIETEVGGRGGATAAPTHHTRTHSHTVLPLVLPRVCSHKHHDTLWLPTNCLRCCNAVIRAANTQPSAPQPRCQHGLQSPNRFKILWSPVLPTHRLQQSPNDDNSVNRAANNRLCSVLQPILPVDRMFRQNTTPCSLLAMVETFHLCPN